MFSGGRFSWGRGGGGGGPGGGGNTPSFIPGTYGNWPPPIFCAIFDIPKPTFFPADLIEKTPRALIIMDRLAGVWDFFAFPQKKKNR